MATFVTQLEGNTMMVVEAETSGAFGKNEGSGQRANPMAAFDLAIETASSMCRIMSFRMAEALRGAPVSTTELDFGVKIDQHGTVMVAQEADRAQFKVKLTVRVNQP